MIPTRGQYWLLDKTEGGMTARTLFQCPSAVGKGVLIAPTVHGNLIVGPDSEILPEEDTSTTAGGLAFVKSAAARSIPNINFRANIRNFAGVRARSDSKDFIIEEAEPGFVDVAGICSPGLSAAPAIAEYVAALMEASGLEFMKKDDVVTTRKRIRFKELSNPEKAKLVAKCPAYGNIICRCETVTEGEILAAFDEPIPPTTVDAVKRRVGTGMGRCQGGFCGPNVVNILSRKLGIPPEEVLKDAAGSYILEVRDVSGSATSDGVSESVKCNGVSDFAECEQNPEVRDV